jgi:hypothetical protein
LSNSVLTASSTLLMHLGRHRLGGPRLHNIWKDPTPLHTHDQTTNSSTHVTPNVIPTIHLQQNCDYLK